MNRIFSAAAGFLILIAAGAGCATMRQPAAPGGKPGMPGAAAGTDPGQIVAATVNGSAITIDALVKMMNRMGPPRDSGRDGSLGTAEKSALERLIVQELAVQQARTSGITVDPKDIDSAIAEFTAKTGGEQRYRDFLAKQNLSETGLRAEIERGLVLERIYAKEVVEKALVPEDVLQQEYEREKRRYILPEKISVIDVFFVNTGRNDGKEMLEKANAVRKQIAANPGRDPWKLVLDGSFIVRSIDLNREKQPELYRAAKKIKPGRLSGIITAADGLHIVKVKTAVPQRQLTFEETRKTLEARFRGLQQQKRQQEWERELKQNAVIQINEQALQPSGRPADGNRSAGDN